MNQNNVSNPSYQWQAGIRMMSPTRVLFFYCLPNLWRECTWRKMGICWGAGQGGERCLRDGTRQPLLEFEFKQRWFQEGQFWLSLTLKISNWKWFLLMEWDCNTHVTVVKPLKSPRPRGKMGSGAAESRGRRKVAKKVPLLPGDRVYLLVDKTTEQLCIM